MPQALSTIKKGTEVRIVGIDDSPIKPKLLEMGLVKGKQITLLFKAPLGDPIAIDVHGYVLSLRLDEAKHVHVEPVIQNS
jgi:Fe2+ transport system protein FeoA